MEVGELLPQNTQQKIIWVSDSITVAFPREKKTKLGENNLIKSSKAKDGWLSKHI